MKHSAHPRATLAILLAVAVAALFPAHASAQVAGETLTTPPTAAAGATPAETAPANAEAVKTAEPAMVCRTVRVTGSRLRKERVCTTKSSSKDAQDWLQRQQEKGATLNSDVNGGG